MNSLTITAIAIGSVVMIFFTYQVLMTIVRIEGSFERWAAEHHFRILQRQAWLYYQGPFFPNKYFPTYFITVEDQQHRQKHGWIRLGFWYGVGFREKIEVYWND